MRMPSIMQLVVKDAEQHEPALVAQLAARTATVRTWGPVTQGTGGQYIRPHHQ